MKDLSDIAAPGNSGLPWTILGTRSPQRYWLAGAQVPSVFFFSCHCQSCHKNTLLEARQVIFVI